MSWSVINAKKKTVKCYKLAPVAKRLARNTDECIDDSNFSNFKFSEDWIRGLIGKLCNRAITHKAQEKTTVNYETTSIVKSFIENCSEVSATYECENIYNMDETPHYLDIPNRTTVDVVGKKSKETKTSGNEKKRFTVCLTIKADGTMLISDFLFQMLISIISETKKGAES